MKDRYYHTHEINSIDIRSVIALVGEYPLGYVGNRVRCPDPSHKDEHPSAYIYRDANRCVCFSCQKSFTPIDIVMANRNCDWKEACDIIIEAFDCEGMYEDTKEAERFPLTTKDLICIGLEGYLLKPIPLSYHMDEHERITVRKTVSYGIRDLWKEDRESFNELIYEKACEAVEYHEARIASNIEFADSIDEELKRSGVDPKVFELTTLPEDVEERKALQFYYMAREYRHDAEKIGESLERAKEIRDEYREYCQERDEEEVEHETL